MRGTERLSWGLLAVTFVGWALTLGSMNAEAEGTVSGTGGGGVSSASSSPPPASEPIDRACRVFEINVDDGQGGYFETSDRTGSVGEWVGNMEDAGWSLHQVDYEVGQRVTGYRVTEVMVCVTRARSDMALPWPVEEG